MTIGDAEIARWADAVRDRAQREGWTVAVAESLTGGGLSTALAKSNDAGEWFAGGVVAYRTPTKQRVLGVPEGPVVSATAARAMATGVRDLMGADLAAAVTGVGGPDPQDGQPPGRVFLCIASPTGIREVDDSFPGDPDEVVAQTIRRALQLLAEG